MSRIRIGTRGSLLARWQAEHVQGRLEALGHEVSLVIITTTGDRRASAVSRTHRTITSSTQSKAGTA